MSPNFDEKEMLDAHKKIDHGLLRARKRMFIFHPVCFATISHSSRNISVL